MSGLLFNGVNGRADLRAMHYLGIGRAKIVYRDDLGIAAFCSPTSRMLPSDWLELTRWCLWGGKNAGSMQWRRIRRWLLNKSKSTTVVSYSDPSVGHTGALYAACNWLWAPTWHEIVPPPTGGGCRGGKIHSVKRRWVFPLRQDGKRSRCLRLEETYLLRFPWADYGDDKGANRKHTPTQDRP